MAITQQKNFDNTFSRIYFLFWVRNQRVTNRRTDIVRQRIHSTGCTAR